MTKKFTLIALTFAVLGIFSCTQEDKFNVSIEGKIDGIRKGKIYLQRIQDSTLVSIDSAFFEGNENFTLKTNVEEPEMMLLVLQKHGSEDYTDYLTLFVEQGEYSINSGLSNFQLAEIETQNPNQKKWKEYNAMIAKFNNQQLDLIADQMRVDEDEREIIQNRLESLNKRRYFYTINFALSNKELSISPYVIITEAFDANIKYLDSVYNSLPADVANSLYGVQMKDLLDERKSEEIEVEEDLL